MQLYSILGVLLSLIGIFFKPGYDILMQKLTE